MRRPILNPWLLLILCIAAPLGTAAEQADASAISQEVQQSDVFKLVRSLAADSFAERRKAFMKLWALGPDVLTAFESTQIAGDAKIAESLRVLRILLQLDIKPGDSHSAGVLQLLESPTPLSVSELCRQGHWQAALELIESNPSLQSEFRTNTGPLQTGRIVELALEEGAPLKAWPIIKQLVDYPVGLWIANKLNIEPPEVDTTDTLMVATRDFLIGDAQAAANAPLAAEDRIRFIARGFLWDMLKSTEVQNLFTQTDSAEAQRIIRSVLFELAGEVDAAQRLWREATTNSVDANSTEKSDKPISGSSPKTKEPAEDKSEEAPVERPDQGAADEPAIGTEVAAILELLRLDPARDRIALALITNGKTEAIELYLAETDPSHAVSYFISTNQFARAFAVVGLNSDLSNFDQWLRIQDQQLTSTYKTSLVWMKVVSHCARICNTLTEIGHRDEAQKLLRMLIDQAQSIRNSRAADRRRREEQLWFEMRWLSRAESRAMLLRETQESFAELPTAAQLRLLSTLYREFASIANFLLETTPIELVQREIDGADDLSLRWELLERLRLLDRTYFQQFKGDVVKSWLTAVQGQLQQAPASGRQLRELAELAVGFGLHELGLDAASEPMATDRSHWAYAAQLVSEQGMPEAAAQYFEVVRTSYGDGRYDALTGEIDALLLAGDYTKAAQLEQFRWLLPLVPANMPRSTYLSIASSLEDEEQYAGALEYAEPAFLLEQGRDILEFETGRIYGSILDELGDRGRSADVRRAAFIEALSPGSQLLQSAMSHHYWSYSDLIRISYAAQKERMARAVTHIGNAQYAEAEYQMQLAAQIQPQDIELVVQCYPLLIEAGKRALADKVFDQYEATMLGQLKAWPDDATALNNLAWMYSQCDRKLEEALELAKRAVALTPSSAVYMDTLAEVQFRMGRIDEAMQSAQHCHALDPRDSHYQQNLIRFQRGS